MPQLFSALRVLGRHTVMKSALVARVCLVLGLMCGTALSASAQQGASGGEWRHYGGDLGSTKYSPLDQINRDNVGDLQVAWRWRTAASGFGCG